MCSLIFSTAIPENIQDANKFLLPRGPDKTVYNVIEGKFFLHNLLTITGDFTPQPIIDSNIVLLFNGQIYNYLEFGDYSCDTLCIIPLYKKYGIDFVKHLDGEFAIVLIDFNERISLITTDTYGTKPLFYSSENGLGAATYKDALTKCGFSLIDKMSANTTLIYDLDTYQLKEKREVTKFNLDQYKTNYDDWLKAFSESISKRCAHNREKLFIGLSSGYDSGVIASELVNQKIPFKCYSVTGSENLDILNKRWNLLRDKCELEIVTITPQMRNEAHEHLLNNTEDWKYTIRSARSDYSESYLSLWDDSGANNLSHICSLAKRDNRKIFISGGGADEIMSDYGHNGISKYQHSNFGGKFPEILTQDFLKNTWLSFYGSSMQSYLKKDEVVSGSYSQEGRYPYIDVRLVQEFLNLSVDLKNSKYKSVLYEYLTRNNFPFEPGQKIGF